ncbi:ankyrin repeat domain-containing protein [Pseudoxanthomonas winnipegensis]|uniref:Uncharacterized protein n=1 Tax=Pseudoxanthomonas winnipegensis TaxID=2480810 RepID=A0A4V2HFX7_9GAMM|nr:ankyrin repeat domain-containing protein [Pseudoxanthomonas winnipegensis]TAA41556.1 hypothetical protein EA655_11480 [Pseudoxanthomonas winnipegensis]
MGFFKTLAENYKQAKEMKARAEFLDALKALNAELGAANNELEEFKRLREEHEKTSKLVRQESYEVLLKQRDLSLTTPVGDTLVHLTVDMGTADQITELCAQGANVNAQNYLGNTPLHMAFALNNLPAAKALLNAGADPDIKNKFGKSAYDLADDNNVPKTFFIGQ